MAQTLTREQVLGTAKLGSRQAAKQLGVAKSTINKYRKMFGIVKTFSGGITDAPEDLHTNAKILILDIESKPHKVYTWGLWDQNIGLNQIVETGGMICFAAKWLGSDDTLFFSVQDNGGDGYKAMVQAAHDLLSEADIVVTYNGDRYDLKRLNNEFLTNKMTPPKPYRSIDLFKINKTQFDLPSRKLDYIAQLTEVGEKLKHTGFDLWVQCMNGDGEAWELMRQYNIEDVKITEGVYIKLLPWLKSVPHIGMFGGTGSDCPYCGSESLTEEGETATQVQVYKLYLCGSCGGWSRGNKPIAKPLTTRIAGR